MAKGIAQRDALIKWLQTQDQTITRKALTKKVAEIWRSSSPRSLVHYLLINNPEIFEDIKILSLSEVKGVTAYREYLEKTHTRDTTTPQLLKDFKKDTGKTFTGSEVHAKNVAREFKEKFNLLSSKLRPPNVAERKALDAYKKLPESTKFSFQSGGPSVVGKTGESAYATWLAKQGLKSSASVRQRFRKLLVREGLWKKAPIKVGERVKTQATRRLGIGTAGSSPYEEQLIKFKRDVLKDLKVPPMTQRTGTKRVLLDLSHRLSYKQLERLGAKYTGSNIGADWIRTNISAVKKLENELSPVYDQQYDLWKKAKKLKTIPKNLTESLDKVNNQIAEIAGKSGGRLQGVQVDPYNLKVGSTPISYKYAADLGTTDVPLSKIKVRSLTDFMFKLNFGEQIKNESIAAGLINKAPKNFKKLLEARVGCAEGCLVAVAKNEPGKITRALTTLPDKVKGAVGLLGRVGTKAAPLAALAVAGAAIEPLVKQFRNDDPSTYLSNPEQQKGMLLSMIEGETPKVDEEILKWQYPGQIAGAAAAVPGSKAVYRARKLPFKERAAMGPVRAALGPVGKVLAGSFSPLGVAASLPIGIAAQRKGGTDWSDIATDPLNWVGPAFASAGSEMATKGIRNPLLLKALRLGMSPGALRIGSRFLGLPGLALTAGMWGYDKWKNRE